MEDERFGFLHSWIPFYYYIVSFHYINPRKDEKLYNVLNH